MNTTKHNEHYLCKAKAGTTPACSTYYQVENNVGTLEAHCNDPHESMTYIKGNSSRQTTVSLDWFNVALTAFDALSLNNGVRDGDAANARLLSEFMLQDKELNPALPSPAEAIAILSCSTLVMSAQDSPFVEFWNYSSTQIDGIHQSFNASLRAQEYASGGGAAYQRSFIIVLLAVFLCNIFVLIYFVVNRGLVTDFSEPPNLFSLAVNSPPNALMRGACGAGPEGRQYSIKWGVEMEGQHLYIADKHASPYGPVGGGARTESVLSFADLLGRRGKWSRVPESTEMTPVVGVGVGGDGGDGGVGDGGAGGRESSRSEQGTPGLVSPAAERAWNREEGVVKTQDGGGSHLSRMFSKMAKKKSVL